MAPFGPGRPRDRCPFTGVEGTSSLRASRSVDDLGCVKTQRRCDSVEWAFCQLSHPGFETSRACLVENDFGKLFSSSFHFLSFYTARIHSGHASLVYGRFIRLNCTMSWARHHRATSTVRYCRRGDRMRRRDFLAVGSVCLIFAKGPSAARTVTNW